MVLLDIGAVLAFIGVYVFGACGINLCYHRLLTHRSFNCPLWLEHAFAIIAVCCVEDTPARWVATHRMHHHRADERPDPHSPLVNFFWSYMGWLFLENTDLGRQVAYDRYARDILRDNFYRFIERNVVWITLAQSLIYFAVGFLIALALGRTLMARFNSAPVCGCGAWSCAPSWSGMSHGAEIPLPICSATAITKPATKPQQRVVAIHRKR